MEYSVLSVLSSGGSIYTPKNKGATDGSLRDAIEEPPKCEEPFHQHITRCFKKQESPSSFF